MEKEKKKLEQWLFALTDEREIERVRKEIKHLKEKLKDKPIIENSFKQQKEKNKKIVKECKELLSKLVE